MVFVEQDITPNDPIQIELNRLGNPIRAIVEKDGKVWEMGMGGSERWIREEAKRVAAEEMEEGKYGRPVRDVRVGSGVAVTGWEPGTPVFVYPRPTQMWTERLKPIQTGGRR
jgi:hypothetical protein